MNAIEVLVGMIGSGKSTFAKWRAADGCLVVCHDDLAAMLHAGSRYEPKLRAMYHCMEEELAAAAIRSGKTVVIDRTHLTKESRERWVKLAHFCGYRAIAVTFPILRPHVHAFRRFQSDHRGLSFENWFTIAEHHAEQAAAEPLDWQAEGFDELIAR